MGVIDRNPGSLMTLMGLKPSIDYEAKHEAPVHTGASVLRYYYYWGSQMLHLNSSSATTAALFVRYSTYLAWSLGWLSRCLLKFLVDVAMMTEGSGAASAYPAQHLYAPVSRPPTGQETLPVGDRYTIFGWQPFPFVPTLWQYKIVLQGNNTIYGASKVDDPIDNRLCCDIDSDCKKIPFPSCR